MRIVGFSGNEHRPSRTQALVEATAAAIARRTGGHALVIDLIDIGPSVRSARVLADLDDRATGLVAAIVGADLLVVGTPIYKGSYSGLFKHFFDLLEPDSLRGKPVVLTATGGSERHTLVVDYHLRGLFGFFLAHTVPTGIFATASDFVDGHPASAPITMRIGMAVDESLRLLRPVESPV